MNVAPISFCDKVAFNVRNETYKTNLLENIFSQYNIIVTDNVCHIYTKRYSKIIQQSSYLLSTNTTGNRYFLYFTKDELENNLCFFVDTKICRGYKYPRIIYTKFRFSDNVFNGTLLYGELIKDYNDKWLFLINDMFSFCGKQLSKSNKLVRIKKIYELLNNFYTDDPILDVCNFQIKRYFEYKQLNYLLTNFIPKLQYNVNGLLFNGFNYKQPNLLLLNRFQNNNNKNTNTTKQKKINLFEINSNSNSNQTIKNTITTTKSKPNKSNKPNKPNKPKTPEQKYPKTNGEFDFIVNRKQGIFQLTCLINNNEKVFGFARIDSLKKQKLILKYLKQLKNDKQLIMKCQYNLKFKKR